MSPFQYLHTGLPFVTAGQPVCAARDTKEETSVKHFLQYQPQMQWEQKPQMSESSILPTP